MKNVNYCNRRYSITALVLVVLLVMFFGCGNKAKEDGETRDSGAKFEKKEKRSHLMLPDFFLRDLEGKEHRLVDYVGKRPILLIFWTTNCRFCLNEIPRINKVFVERSDDLEIISIDILETPRRVEGIARSKGIKYPILFDQQGTTARDYHIRGVPTYIVVDLSGGMRYYGHELDEAMKKIEAILG